MRNTAQAHWRDSARSVKFFIWDGKAVFPMVFFLIYMHVWTFILALTVVCAFSLLNRYGFSPRVFGRWLRTAIAGRRKLSIPWWMQ